jgi:hypothetical protein
MRRRTIAVIITLAFVAAMPALALADSGVISDEPFAFELGG